MVWPTAPGVDWPAIKERWLRGEPASAIAASLPPLADGRRLTRQAIDNQARRHGWKRLNPKVAKHLSAATIDAVAPMLLAKQQATIQPPQSHGAAVSAGRGARTPERAASILELIALGESEAGAATLSGIKPDTLLQWKSDDPVFGDQIEAAKRQFTADNLAAMFKARDRGDAQSTRWLLERSPTTRERWGDQRGGAQGGVSISISFGAPGDAAGQVIDVTPTSAE